jgi:hypothetical protein
VVSTQSPLGSIWPWAGELEANRAQISTSPVQKLRTRWRHFISILLKTNHLIRVSGKQGSACGRAYKPELLMQPEDIAEMVTHSLRLPRSAEVTDISIRPMQKSY